MVTLSDIILFKGEYQTSDKLKMMGLWACSKCGNANHEHLNWCQRCGDEKFVIYASTAREILESKLAPKAEAKIRNIKKFKKAI